LNNLKRGKFSTKKGANFADQGFIIGLILPLIPYWKTNYVYILSEAVIGCHRLTEDLCAVERVYNRSNASWF
jgi:hypothetical protein